MNPLRLVHTILPEINSLMSRIRVDFGGGCSVSKGAVLAALCLMGKGGDSIDIGVYRGRSLVPQALAHRERGRGRVIGVDPYASGEAVEVDNASLRLQLEQFVRDTDFDAVYLAAAEFIRDARLEGHAELRRQSSGTALPQMIGEGVRASLVHIDGNHDTAMVVEDAQNALAITRPEGFVVLDHISWPSVRPAVDLIRQKADLIYARVDSQNDYAVFRIGGSRRNLHALRGRIAEVADAGDRVAA